MSRTLCVILHKERERDSLCQFSQQLPGLLEFRSTLQVWSCRLRLGGRIRNVDHLAFRKAMLARDMSVWGRLHMSPPGAPSPDAKLCTYLQWFARPGRFNIEPYYELPLPATKLRSIFHFGRVLIPCRSSRAGLRCLRCHDICAGAHFVPPMLLATSTIVSMIARVFRAFGSSMQRLSRILMMP